MPPLPFLNHPCKRQIDGQTHLAKEIVAFLNTRGGRIFVGVDDDGSIVRMASGIGVSAPTVTSYLGLLVDLLLVRRLPPYLRNVGKRLVKSPKTYVRDSGLLHALLGIGDFDSLLGHPVIGASWEGFVIENLLAAELAALA